MHNTEIGMARGVPLGGVSSNNGIWNIPSQPEQQRVQTGVRAHRAAYLFKHHDGVSEHSF